MRKHKVEPYIYKASTKETLFSLASASNWARLLLNNSKVYEPFLRSLLEINFFENESSFQDRFTIKKIAEHLGYKTTEVTKWIGEIYNDLFDLNADNELLFKKEGVKHNLLFRYLYDNTASFTIWLQQSPRQFETIYFPLVKAKVGTDRFWVKAVDHTIVDGSQEVDLFLNGGILNRYRELLYERALFERKIGFFEAYKMTEFEIDERLRKEYH